MKALLEEEREREKEDGILIKMASSWEFVIRPLDEDCWLVHAHLLEHVTLKDKIWNYPEISNEANSFTKWFF